MFINLNIHSVYSKMQSTLTLKDIITLSKSQQSIALTDVNTVRGFINFVQFSQSNKVAPIAGVNLITSIDEVVILVEGRQNSDTIFDEADLTMMMQEELSRQSLRDAVKAIVKRTGLPKRNIYQLALKMSDATPPD